MMMRWAIAALLALLPFTPAGANQRIALVIGNAAYAPAVGPLKNPGRDADLIAATLRQRGFAVTTVKDVRRTALVRAVADYAARLAAAGRDAVGFLYYSGHGAANPDTNRNYLIPVDATTAATDTLWYESVPLQEVIDTVSSGARNATSIIVFDACRDALRLAANGKSLGQGSKGLERVEQRTSTLIAFSTSPGAVAADADARGATGPYAAELAAQLAQPNTDVKTMFDNVKFAVFDRTGRKQLPWVEDGLTRRVLLDTGDAPVRLAAAAPVRPTIAAMPTPTKSVADEAPAPSPVAAGGEPRRSGGSIRVGRFTADRACTTYVLTSGRVGTASTDSSAAVVGVGGAAMGASSSRMTAAAWRQDLVRDCQSNFPGLKGSIDRALMAGGPIAAAGRYTLNGRLSAVTADIQTAGSRSYDSGAETISVGVEYNLSDSTGRPVAAGLLAKHVRVGSGLQTADVAAMQDMGGGYATLQRDVALAVARAAIFKLAPLRVVEVEGKRVRLNYGSALVPVESIVTVEAGMSSIRFLVGSATATSALADLRGDGNPARIAPDAIATFIEPDDAAANTPAYERVDLP